MLSVRRRWMLDKAKRLVPYELTEPSWEALYTGETRDTPDETTDEQGNALERWPTWAFVDGGKEWNDYRMRRLTTSIKCRRSSATLDDDIRQIRAHIGSFVPCDNGVPATVDELIIAIGSGNITGSTFHNGCWVPNWWWQVHDISAGSTRGHGCHSNHSAALS